FAIALGAMAVNGSSPFLTPRLNAVRWAFRYLRRGFVALLDAEVDLPLSPQASGDDFDFGPSEDRSAIHE
ncbi:hypothetical protein, partial [Rhodovulum sulfidophilum]|uniref:hypothetical protein n=1 Tax=Rhodovulum sulfidophilum TaxID=35806 RepID=UPI001F1E5E01